MSGTPTFFINGRRHYGVYDIDTLTEAVRAAKTKGAAARRAEPMPPLEEDPGLTCPCGPTIVVRTTIVLS